MKFEFKDQPIEKIIETLTSFLEGRKLGEMVEFIDNGEDLDVIINKLGKSKLSFSSTCKDGKRCFNLENEKIAFTHKAFKNEVTDKIKSIIVKSGGTISE